MSSKPPMLQRLVRLFSWPPPPPNERVMARRRWSEETAALGVAMAHKKAHELELKLAEANAEIARLRKLLGD